MAAQTGANLCSAQNKGHTLPARYQTF